MVIIGPGIYPMAQSPAWEKEALVKQIERSRCRLIVNILLWQVALVCGFTM